MKKTKAEREGDDEEIEAKSEGENEERKTEGRRGRDSGGRV